MGSCASTKNLKQKLKTAGIGEATPTDTNRAQSENKLSASPAIIKSLEIEASDEKMVKKKPTNKIFKKKLNFETIKMGLFTNYTKLSLNLKDIEDDFQDG